MSTSQTFKIPEENLGRFKTVIGRINARAAKLGFDPITVEIGEGVKTSMRDDSAVGSLDEYILVLVHPVTVTGAQPVLSGYRFVGKVEHMRGTTETIVKGEVPAQYHQCEPNCDHCQVNRQRAETVILQSVESGDYKQVGKSCLKDFFNGDDPMKHAAFMQFLFSCSEELKGMEEFEGGGGSRDAYIEPMDVLPLAAAVIRTDGYINSGRAEELGCMPTGAVIRSMLSNGSRVKRPAITDADRAKAEAVLTWLNSDEARSKKHDSNYMHNLCVMAQTGLVKQKNIAIMASAVVVFDKNEAAKQRDAVVSNSEFIGEVDGKIGPVPVTVIAQIVIPNAMYGDKVLYTMADDHGNQFAWFNSGAALAEVGDRLHINATVKAHEEYRGVKQTTLLRVNSLENNLLSAVESGKDVKAVKKLLKDEIDLEHVSIRRGRTALMLAALQGRDDLIAALLEAGADPDFAGATGDNTGETAAMMAASSGHAITVAKLEEWGADLALQSRFGDTAKSLLLEVQEDLRKRAAPFEGACVEAEGRVPAKELAWSKVAQYPIANLGKTCKEWADDFDTRIAEAEEKGDLQQFLHSLSDYFRPPIVVIQREGKLHLWHGHDQIGNAARGGDKTVALFLGSDSPEFEAHSAPVQAPKASKAKTKAAPVAQDTPSAIEHP